ncbi:UNVERIFIED_CONTAM: hypothetical protein Slati_2931900 [Sesamum latifolium]|uniref:Transposase MuDR plant domain-containing protein n=1 Tax=Sesamum latifolium TaxID=2727402 RepID=A0AAW2VIM9_9LAMI
MEESGDESGDESMEESGDESGDESMEEFGDKIEEINNQTGVVSGDKMSDYKSDNHYESKNQSDSELEDDPLKGSLNRCIKTLKEFVIQEGFKIMRMRNKTTRVTAYCSVKDCPWRIHAAPLVDGVTFQVKTYVPNHTCVRSNPTSEASVDWVAIKIESVLRENLGMKIRGLSALRDVFLEGCGPFLDFDGCHSKGPFGGVLLAAIGLDGNNGLFPVAFAAVESECKESWSFFFENLSRMVGSFSVDKP